MERKGSCCESALASLRHDRWWEEKGVYQRHATLGRMRLG